jgi:hypothetical protein
LIIESEEVGLAKLYFSHKVLKVFAGVGAGVGVGVCVGVCAKVGVGTGVEEATGVGDFEGMELGVELGTGLAAGVKTLTPLSHTNFLPYLIHVYLSPAEILI